MPETLWNDDWHRSYNRIWPEQQARFNRKCRLVVQPLRANSGNKLGNNHGDQVIIQLVIQFIDAIEYGFR